LRKNILAKKIYHKFPEFYFFNRQKRLFNLLKFSTIANNMKQHFLFLGATFRQNAKRNFVASNIRFFSEKKLPNVFLNKISF
jgi:hypothetical protein